MSAPSETVRIAIAGASSLRGKELKLLIEESDFPAGEIRLLDEELAAGILTEAGGEPAVIEKVDQDSFERVRFAFFAGSPAFSMRHVAEARREGATVIDLSGGTPEGSDAMLWIPALDSILPSLKAGPVRGEPRSFFVAPSAPADASISLSAALAPLGLERLVLTFFQPASERGRAAIDELESQVVKLLTFEPIPQVVYDAQVGFNMLSRYGEQSQEKLAAARAGIVGEVKAYLTGRSLMPAIALVQAPVFHSHAFTAYAEFKMVVALESITASMETAGLKVAAADDPPPTNVTVAGESRPVLGRPERDTEIETGVWLWGAADNLRVPAANALAIAEKLLAS